MKTINEIKKEYKEINDKLSELYEYDLIKIIQQKREEIMSELDKIHNQAEGIPVKCETKPFDINNINWKFLIDTKGKQIYSKSDYDFYEILVCCYWIECGSFYLAALKHNEEFKKLIEEYNSFIDEMRDK